MRRKERDKDIKHLVEFFSKEQLAKLYVDAREDVIKSATDCAKWHIRYLEIKRRKHENRKH